MRPTVKQSGVLLGAMLLALAAASGEARGQGTERDPAEDVRRDLLGAGMDVAEALLGPRPLPAAPDWAVPPAVSDRGPIFTFVLIADIHHSAATERFLIAAAEHSNKTIRPDLVLLAGDNVSRPYTVEHHRELKAILTELFPAPVFAVTGDNDARHFHDVFGPSDWTLEVAGIRVIGLALDEDVEGEGIGTLDDATYNWLDAEIAARKDAPTLLLIHEPVLPPTFLGAPRLAAFLAAPGREHVVAVLAGHLHFDGEVRLGGQTHILAPGLGIVHAFKECLVYEDRIVIRTHEWDGEKGGFAFASKWQRIEFPEGLRASREVRVPGASPPPAEAAAARARLVPRPGEVRTRFPDDLARRFGLVKRASAAVLRAIGRVREGLRSE